MAGVGSYQLKRDGRTEWSAELFAIVGLEPTAPAPSMPGHLLSLVHEEDRARLEAAYQRLADDRVAFDVEYRIVRPDGTVRYLQSIAIPSDPDAGSGPAHVGFVRDLTDERVRVNEERASQALKMEALGRLAAGVAHDFNNVLLAILGRAELLQEELAEDDPRRHHAAEILAAADHAAGLTRNLLAFSRPHGSEQSIVDLNQIVSETAALLRPLVHVNIELETALAPAPLLVSVDATRLRQIVVNLALNARDAMPGGGRMTITTAVAPGNRRREGAAAGWVTLAVRDTGVGMTERVQAHLFEPYFTTKEVGKGTGLGLATVYGFVQQAGGTIRVVSAPGKGASFEISLPRSEQPAATASQDPPPAPPRASSSPGHGEVVLLVEDYDGARVVLGEVLEESGYRTLVASSGEDALAQCEGLDRPIGVLLTDLQMPGLSGIELAESLRARWPGLKVIFMSGDAPEVELPDAVFLQKPIKLDEVLHRIRHILDAG